MSNASNRRRVMGESPSSFVSGPITLIDVVESIRRSSDSSASVADIDDIETRVMQRLGTSELIINDDDAMVAAIDWDLELECLARQGTPQAEPVPARGWRRALPYRLATFLATIMFLAAIGGSVADFGDPRPTPYTPTSDRIGPKEIDVPVVSPGLASASKHSSLPSAAADPPTSVQPGTEVPPAPPRGEECNLGEGTVCITVPLPAVPDLMEALP